MGILSLNVLITNKACNHLGRIWLLGSILYAPSEPKGLVLRISNLSSLLIFNNRPVCKTIKHGLSR